MDGFKDVDFFIKAYTMGLIPNSKDTWQMQYDEAAYHDLHADFPVISNGKLPGGGVSLKNASLNCAVINKKDRKYTHAHSQEDIVQRICRTLILKNNLNNL